MSKEKQIEEIADVLYESDNKRNVVICGIEQVAEDIYNAGYRKQSEAEWVWKKKIEPQAQNRLYCSICDEECLAKNNYYVKSNFCPNCGAKMKGGME